MRAVTDRDALDVAAGAAREALGELRAARHDRAAREELLALWHQYTEALGEATLWSGRIIAAAAERGEPCPLCRQDGAS
jgi:hypothetical protein